MSTLIFILTFILSFSQNVVQNGGFEDYSSLPTGANQIHLATPWINFITSTDFLYAGSYNGWMAHHGGPHSGNGFAGLRTDYSVNGTGEAIVQELAPNNRLISGKEYHISLWAKRTTSTTGYSQICEGISLFGYDSLIGNNLAYAYAGNLPTAQTLWTSDVVADTSWTLYEGCFVVPDFDKWSADHIAFAIQQAPSCGHYVYLDDIQILPYEFELGSDVELCDEEEVVIDAEVPFGHSYIWQDNSADPQYYPIQDGLYEVVVATYCGELYDDIYVNFRECDCKIFFPNSFTPNGDGINDGFFGKHDCYIIDFELLIFDRWGAIVFQTTDLYDTWNGGNSPVGAYAYKAEYVPADGNRITDIGSVTLIR